MARPRKQTLTMKQYLDNVREGYISNDADTQRNPAWKPIVDGLAVTVLTDDYVPSIILAEEDSGQTHIADGGSRTTAWMMIRFGNYKIKSSVENPIIPYKKMVKDKNGKIIWEDATFDIRNKTFEQFPKELQKKFDEYQVDMVVHEHCTKDIIAMYIKRYNEHKAMNANQKMFVYLPVFAEKIRNISSRKFFISNCDINDNEKEKGILERIISESVMCMFHFDKWNKNGKKLAIYLNDNSSDEEFDKLNSNLERLERIITDETKTLFNSKNCFIWLTLFDYFSELGIDDSKFADFLSAFEKLRNKTVDGKMFDTVDEVGSTKDKQVIKDKLHILGTLMKEYLHIEETEEVKPATDEEFISIMTGVSVENVKEDMDLYEETLKDLTDNTIRDGSKLLDKDNHLSLLAMVAYSYENEVDLDRWMEDYAANNNKYLKDQKRNYEIMIASLNDFQRRGKVA